MEPGVPGAEHQADAGIGGLLMGGLGRSIRVDTAGGQAMIMNDVRISGRRCGSATIFVSEPDDTRISVLGPKRRGRDHRVWFADWKSFCGADS